ncbi:hypothetical protein KXD93_14435 [Mucilaginibacter sp. BJC16-A38]|uniref:hypothetical protein n=1 Tax=Mucilaginibacter phenanthrenivorans TaxID=1234842 RepID=UPI00215718C9|nr:hypothetical protein [Mucilaginibacter phenanthrenivorans]MCR8558852.1 hypothetical protein [Mucilaginibacter phenanthrenivorans]
MNGRKLRRFREFICYAMEFMGIDHNNPKGDYLRQLLQDKLIQHTHYINTNSKDMPQILNWKWNNQPNGQ